MESSHFYYTAGVIVQIKTKGWRPLAASASGESAASRRAARAGQAKVGWYS